jgi:response regulator RpfG family c-di-GMP phosphodiesterase
MTPQPAKPRVLIVDDHPANRRAFETLLEDKYTIGVAATGYQALELTLRDDYAVVLLDVRMPGMDGFEVAELLRRRERSRHTPIVFISAFDQTVFNQKQGYVAGATDFIFSPVDEDLLKLKVATYVEIYLRNESLRLRILELEKTLSSLHTEFKRLDPSRTVLEQRIRSLEVIIESLKQELNSIPS